jgi:hypothetical protein
MKYYFVTIQTSNYKSSSIENTLIDQHPYDFVKKWQNIYDKERMGIRVIVLFYAEITKKYYDEKTT